jgi:purine nucleosidase
MKRQRVIIDCDPGVDDALALMFAFGSPEIDVVGVTTVLGNAPLDTTTRNARRLVALSGRTVPVAKGCGRPIMAPFVRTWPSVHGADGLGGVELPEPTAALDPRHAVDFIIETVLAAPGEITLCPIGPMTNVALAIIKEPRVALAVKQVVFMGGAAFGPGNATPLSEFNIYVDPEAAAIVVTSGAPLVMFGLDVTRQAKITEDWLGRIARLGPTGAALTAMLRAYGGSDPALHDPCALAFLVAPDLFTGVEAHLEVATAPGPARGATIASVRERHLAGKAANATVLTGCDAPRLLALMEERLATLDGIVTNGTAMAV